MTLSLKAKALKAWQRCVFALTTRKSLNRRVRNENDEIRWTMSLTHFYFVAGMLNYNSNNKQLLKPGRRGSCTGGVISS